MARNYILRLLLISTILVIFIRCSTSRYLQNFDMTSLAPEYTVVPEQDFLPMSLSVMADLNVCPLQSINFNNGQHSKVNHNNEFIIDTLKFGKTDKFLVYDVDCLDTIGLHPFNGYNIHWNIPQFDGGLTLNWRIVKVFSLFGQFNASFHEKQEYFRALFGPAIHHQGDALGFRVGLHIGFLNYSYKLSYLTNLHSIALTDTIIFNRQGDYLLIVEERKNRNRLFLNINMTLNTMNEYLFLKYYGNFGYERVNMYSNNSLAGEDLKVKFSFLTIQMGAFKELADWTLLAGIGLRYENRLKNGLEQVNAADTPLIPRFNFTVSYYLKGKNTYPNSKPILSTTKYKTPR
jgi:hypothetical protein